MNDKVDIIKEADERKGSREVVSVSAYGKSSIQISVNNSRVETSSKKRDRDDYDRRKVKYSSHSSERRSSKTPPRTYPRETRWEEYPDGRKKTEAHMKSVIISSERSRRSESSSRSSRRMDDIRSYINYRADYYWYAKFRIDWERWTEDMDKCGVKSLLDYIEFFADIVISRRDSGRGCYELQCFLDHYVDPSSSTKSVNDKMLEMNCTRQKMILRFEKYSGFVNALFDIVSWHLMTACPFIKSRWEKSAVHSQFAYKDLYSYTSSSKTEMSSMISYFTNTAEYQEAPYLAESNRHVGKKKQK